MIHKSRLIVFALWALISTGCYDPVDEVVIEGPPPIPKIVRWDTSIEIYSSVNWPELIHTDLFQGFKPGMTFKDAVRLVGPPDKTGKGLWGPYYEYRRPNGSVRVSFETIGSGTMGAEFTKWRLTAFPNERSIDTIFHPILRERLEADFRKQTEIIILAPNGEHPAVQVTIRDDQVYSIEWLFE